MQAKVTIKDQVAEFRAVMMQTVSIPLALTIAAEESRELHEATTILSSTVPTVEKATHCLKELADVLYTVIGLSMSINEENAAMGDFIWSPADLEGPQISEWEDIMQGKVAATELNNLFFTDEIITEAIARVHASNLTKVGDDGKPVYNEHGKVTKGPNYKAPDLSDLVVDAMPRLMALWYENPASQSRAA